MTNQPSPDMESLAAELLEFAAELHEKAAKARVKNRPLAAGYEVEANLCLRAADAVSRPAIISPDMGQSVSDDYLAEIEGLLKAASPGPWTACGVREAGDLSSINPENNIVAPRKHQNDACSCGFVWSKPADIPVMEAIGGPWGDTYPAIRLLEDGSFEAYQERVDYGEVPREIQAANMKFVARAPEIVATLITRIRDLEAAERLRAPVGGDGKFDQAIWFEEQDRAWGQDKFLNLTIEPLILQLMEAAALTAMARVRCAIPDGWRDIESAPKDGSRMLFGYAGETFYHIGYWEADWTWGPAWVDGHHAVKPTHWMPLPAAPTLPIAKGK